MFGAFRFLLAVMVVITHLGGRSALFHYGVYGVFGFYVVSGFLMTAILQRTYGFDLRGSTSFWMNRFLRIFPAYHLVALATLVLVGLFPREAVYFQPAWWISDRWIDWLGNLLLFPYSFYDQRFRLVPPTWSVGVELVCYFVVWLVMARSRRLAWLCAALGVGWVAWALWAGLVWSARYMPVQAAILPFSVGSLIFHHGRPLRRRLGDRALGLAAGGVLLIVAHAILAFLPGETYALGAGFYVNFVLVSGVSALLAVSDPPSRRMREIDGWLGRLSYPLFLVHWSVGFALVLAFPALGRSPLLLAASLGPSLLVSWLLVRLVDDPIQKLRDRLRVRPRGGVQAPAAGAVR